MILAMKYMSEIQEFCNFKNWKVVRGFYVFKQDPRMLNEPLL